MRVLTTRRRARLAIPAALAAVALIAAGCGSDDSGGSGGDGGAAADVLGAENAASGDPVKIGWVSTGQTQAIDTSDEIAAAQAVVAYANERLGGLGGRPIELVVCEDKNTPADAQACGNKFISEGVSAVAAGTTGQIDGVLSVVAPAGIPAGVNLVSSQVALGTPNVFVWSNPVSAYGVPAAFAREEKIDSAAVVVIDVPGASGPAKRLAPAFWGNAGSEAAVVPIAPGTADMTPQVQAAENAGPGMYYILGDPTFCSSAIRAIKTLGIKAPIVALDRCIGEDKGASIPGGFDGVSIVSQSIQEPGDEEYDLYTAVLDQYGDKLANTSQAVSGYQGMLSFVRAVNAAKPTSLDAAGVLAGLKSMPATPYPLGGGADFQCNGQALAAISPNICSTAGFIADSSSDGKLSNFHVLDTEGIYKLGG
jgi:ABC-type branched-subunit amino acid transport system substrate-binding protein